MIARYDFDEELITAAKGAARPLARALAWPPPGAPRVAIVLGRGGKPEVEVSLAAAAGDGVPLLRRRGGGCAVVLDPGNVVVSLAWPQPGLGGVTTAFTRASSWIIDLLSRCGVTGVTREGVSDLAWEGRKVGGSCLWRTQGLAYYSTTLLVDPDLTLVERYLPHPPREPVWRAGRTHREFMGRLPLPDAARDGRTFAQRLSRELDAAGSCNLEDAKP